MPKKIFLILITLCTAFFVQAQDNKDEIQKKQKQLLQEIAELNSTLNKIKQNKTQSVNQLAIVQRKINARKELINNINKDLHRLDDNIYKNQQEINRYKKEIDTLKMQYAKSLVFAYKNRSNYDYLNFLFSANSFNDAVKRIAYLKSYRQYRETQVNNILKTQQLLQQQVGVLNNNKTEKSSSLTLQSKQMKVLQDDKQEQDLVVRELKGQEKNIAAQIKEKEKTRQKLQNALQAIINREIAAAKKKQEEEEKKRKLALAQQQNSNTPDNTSTSSGSTQKLNTTGGMTALNKGGRSYSAFESTTEDMNVSINFENNKGRLPWPADQGYVSTHFGPYQIPDTKIKGIMAGVEISLPTGSNIKAVADGIITAVFDMGSSQAVVIRHGKYFTTYSNLSSVNVSKDQQVKAGKILGRSAPSMGNDSQVIFMVTNDKNQNQNPELWLKPR